ncbi:hypothetical protein MNBD_GAMMA12-3978 [hydrothermal vent metagenome]|uniref:Uncharacterized protein n=1 Tax=hydrothermal vent metagenome TaxID=652676 RepID=A0A3B0Y4U2_9ZZZZ
MNLANMKLHFLYAVFGLALGVTLSLGGLSDFSQIHSLFILQNIPLLLTFAGAIGLSILGFMLIQTNTKAPKKPFTKGTIPGSILFGLGWAITGACPSIALVQLGEGQLAALVTIAGIVSGVWIYRKATSTSFQFDTGICGEE